MAQGEIQMILATNLIVPQAKFNFKLDTFISGKNIKNIKLSEQQNHNYDTFVDLRSIRNKNETSRLYNQS